MALRESKKRLARTVLDNTFGSPANQKRGFPSDDKASFSAATLLAPRIGVAFSTAQALVLDWYAGRLP